MGRARLLSLLLLVAAVAACGSSQPSARHTASSQDSVASLPAAHPQAIEPLAGQAASGGQQPAPAAQVSVGPSSTGLKQPVSDAQIRQELASSGLTPNANQATLTPDGLAIAPLAAPPAVQAVIQAGNEIAHLPYRWGGGHVTYEDTAYDCSGSISFVFQAAHLLSGPIVSGELASWGEPGPGKWITIFANGGHTFMYVAGLRFDTVALAQTGDRWSARSANEPDLRTFSIRHPPGL